MSQEEPRRNHRPGAWQHLAEESERRFDELRDAAEITHPPIAQSERLEGRNAELKARIVTRDEQIAQLTEFTTLAISRLAAQHDEIEGLRRQVTGNGVVRRLPEATHRIAPFGSCGEGRSRLVTRVPLTASAKPPGRPTWAVAVQDPGKAVAVPLEPRWFPVRAVGGRRERDAAQLIGPKISVRSKSASMPSSTAPSCFSSYLKCVSMTASIPSR